MLKQLVLITFVLLGPFRSIQLRAEVDFTREVRPILAKHCFKCHGLDERARKGNLRLDRREDALNSGKSGSSAITPGAPEKSELIRRIVSKDPDELMPPPAAKHTLSQTNIEVLTRWVREGATYRPHWAFEPPLETTPPAYQAGRHLSEHPIDRFVGERLAQKGLHPAEPASKEALLRRVSLDLIGLPPTPTEIHTFINDNSEDVYEKTIDRLLASPRYGERWAKKWLDLARYADTNGYEKDRPRSIWPYRDWVIRAINQDLPFDRFTVEQIAGDMLPSPTRDQLIATGFHRNTMLNEEGGIDPLEFRFHAMTDRVATTGSTWLGLTLGCAQCHTHKSDPILHHEYYQLFALLNNADEPELELREPQHDEITQKNRERADALLKKLPEKWPLETSKWSTPKILSVTQTSAQTATVDSDGTIITISEAPETDSTTIHLQTTTQSIELLRLEVIPDKRLPAGGPGRAKNGNFVLSEIEVFAKPIGSPDADEKRIAIASAEASLEQDRFPIRNALDQNPKTGWAIDPGPKRGPLGVSREATFRFEKPFHAKTDIQLRVVLHQQFGSKHVLGKFRLSVPSSPEPLPQVEEQRKQSLDAAFTAWVKERSAHAAKWTSLKPAKATSNLPLLTPLPDNSILASGDISKDDTYEVAFDSIPAGTTALRLEALPDSTLPAHGPGLTYYEGPKGDFFLGEFSASQEGVPLPFSGASESYSANNFGSAPVNAALALDGDPQTGWSCAKRPGTASWAIFSLAQPLPRTAPITVKLRFGRHYACSLGRFRISATNATNTLKASDISTDVDILLTREQSSWSDREREKLLHAFLLSTPQLAQDSKQIRDLQNPVLGPTTLVMRERPKAHPRATHLHHRGEFLQVKEPVTPDLPSQLRAQGTSLVHSRLDFAKWLVSPENTLTARVVVNRHWAAFFGRGIVKTLADFGVQGDAPSHPELLDWMALELQRKGWSIKQLHRLIVTSRTYQQSSVITSEALETDPENILLARGPRVRLEAEQIRDSMLHATGLLSSKMFGPPVYPPQPQGVTESSYGGGGWNTSQGEDRYRRSIYTFMKRSAPFAMAGTFDAPSGEVCVARRESTNTPLQSLTLLNDDAFIEMARHAGNAAAESVSDDATRITELHLRFTGRYPDASERDHLQRYLDKQRARLLSGELKANVLHPSTKPTALESAAWTLLVRALMNLDESITKN